jgi:hypothetical protein
MPPTAFPEGIDQVEVQTVPGAGRTYLKFVSSIVPRADHGRNLRPEEGFVE